MSLPSPNILNTLHTATDYINANCSASLRVGASGMDFIKNTTIDKAVLLKDSTGIRRQIEWININIDTFRKDAHVSGDLASLGWDKEKASRFVSYTKHLDTLVKSVEKRNLDAMEKLANSRDADWPKEVTEDYESFRLRIDIVTHYNMMFIDIVKLRDLALDAVIAFSKAF